MARLLYITTVSSTARHFLTPFGRHFRRLGWTVDAAAAGIGECDHCAGAFDRRYEIDWSRSPLAPRNLTRCATKLRRLLLHGRYDIVHVHTPVAGFVCRLVTRSLPSALRPRVVYTAHGFHFHPEGRRITNALYLTLERLAGLATDQLIVINDHDYSAAVASRIVSPDRVLHVPGIGIDLDHYRPDRVPEALVQSWRNRIPVPADAPTLLMIAEFSPRKRHLDLIQAMARVQRTDLHLVLAGRGPEMEHVRQTAARLGLAPRVHIAGFVEDVRPAVLTSMATVLPSEYEGLPRSVLESMALGVPVVASRIRGNWDLLRDGAGELFTLGDMDDLAAAIDRVSNSPERRGSMTATARNRVHAYELQNVLRLHEEVYRTVLTAGGPTRSTA